MPSHKFSVRLSPEKLRFEMAILIPASFGRLNFPTRAQVSSMKVSASANLRTSRRDSVDWVKETSSFFEQDKRPIMLFDGNNVYL